MTRVIVLAHDGAGWRSAFAGACEDGILPFTLVVDDQPGTERISVVMSQTELDAASARRAAELPPETAEIWTLQLVFAKETP